MEQVTASSFPYIADALAPPHLRITIGALAKAIAYAQLVDLSFSGSECIGYLLADPDKDVGLVCDVLLANGQKVSGSSAELGPDEVLEAGREILEKGLMAIGWFHSHGHHSAFHSSVDDTNTGELLEELSQSLSEDIEVALDDQPEPVQLSVSMVYSLVVNPRMEHHSEVWISATCPTCEHLHQYRQKLELGITDTGLEEGAEISDAVLVEAIKALDLEALEAEVTKRVSEKHKWGGSSSYGGHGSYYGHNYYNNWEPERPTMGPITTADTSSVGSAEAMELGPKGPSTEFESESPDPDDTHKSMGQLILEAEMGTTDPMHSEDMPDIEGTRSGGTEPSDGREDGDLYHPMYSDLGGVGESKGERRRGKEKHKKGKSKQKPDQGTGYDRVEAEPEGDGTKVTYYKGGKVVRVEWLGKGYEETHGQAHKGSSLPVAPHKLPEPQGRSWKQFVTELDVDN